jgi:Ribosome 60S biogenesis N-terminal
VDWRKLVFVVSLDDDPSAFPESDPIKTYLAQSPECDELFRAWDYTVAHNAQSAQLLDVMAFTLTSARMLGYRATGTSMVRRIIRNYMPVIYRNLNSGTHVLIAGTLRLLVAMVMHGQTTTRELEAAFNFSLKPLQSFLRIKKKKVGTSDDTGKEVSKSSSEDDIRTLYVKFILGFFIRGDASVKKSLLDTKGVVAFILKDLKNDSFEVIDFVLSALRKGLVDDVHLARSPKIAFFKPFVLEQICALFSLNDKENPRHTSKDGRKTAADLVEVFMDHLCLTPGVGICFADDGWYPPAFRKDVDSEEVASKNIKTETKEVKAKSVKVYNVVLLRFLATLNFSSDMKQRALFLRILEANLELVHAYF